MIRLLMHISSGTFYRTSEVRTDAYCI